MQIRSLAGQVEMLGAQLSRAGARNLQLGAELKAANRTAQELRMAGFSAKALKKAGFPQQCKMCACNPCADIDQEAIRELIDS